MTGKEQVPSKSRIDALCDADVQALLGGITERFASEARGTPAHEAKIRLGKKRRFLDELVKRRVLHLMYDRYVPAFLAFESQGADPRKRARTCAMIVLEALKRLYVKNGPQDLTLDNVHAEVQVDYPMVSADDVSDRIRRRMVNLGLLIATDFPNLVGSWSFSADDKVTSIRVRDGILDFETVEASWNEELQRRDSEAAALGFVDRSEYLPPTRAKSRVSAPIDFSFVADARLKGIIERDYAELQGIKLAGALKSRIIVSGGLIEALLLDTLAVDNQRALQAERAEKGREGRVKPLEEWHLDRLIEVALELNLVTPAVQKFAHGVQSYRNLVHPGKEVRLQHKIAAQEADIAESVLDIVIRDLRERSKKAR